MNLKKLVLTLGGRLPGWAGIPPVYAVIVLILYTWTIMWFFWKIPSWLLFMNLGELLSAFSFAMLTNLLESLVVLILVLLPALVLPAGWFREAFTARGSVLAAASLGWMMFVADKFQIKADYPSALINGSPLVLAVIFALSVLVGMHPTLRKLIESVADRLTVFLFVSLPLSLLALIYVGIDAIF